MATNTFAVNQRVRYFSKHPEHEPMGTITSIVPVDHLVISWDDDHMPTSIDAIEAMRKIEIC